MVAPAAQRRRDRRRRKSSSSDFARHYRGSIALSLAPGTLLFVTFIVLPLVVMAITTFYDWRASGLEFSGLSNISRLISDLAFRMALKNQILWLLVANLVQVPIAVFFALLLSRKMAGWKVFRTLFFLPNIVSFAAMALVFQAFYNARYGMLNQGLELVGLAGLQHDWLFNTSTALWSIFGTFIFRIGVLVIILLAAIAAISDSIFEAAEIDGASPLQRDLRITLPLLRPTIGICMVLATAAALVYFEGIFIMTGGGPANRTLNLPMLAYRSYTNFDWGYTNTIGMVILLVGLVTLLLIRRVFGLGGEEQ